MVDAVWMVVGEVSAQVLELWKARHMGQGRDPHIAWELRDPRGLCLASESALMRH